MTDTRPPRRSRMDSAPVVALAISIVALLVAGALLYSNLQERRAEADLRAKAQAAEIATIRAELAADHKRSFAATCAIFSHIPPDHGAVDRFRELIKCGKYVGPDKSPASTPVKPSTGTDTPVGSRTSSSVPPRPVSSPSGPTTSVANRPNPAPSAPRPSTPAPSRPKPTPAATASPSPRPSSSPSASHLVCVLGVCL